MAFNVRTVDDDVRVVDLAGELDHYNGTKLIQETLDPLKKIPGVKLVLNFSRVAYICSAAIALLIEIKDRVDTGSGSVAICSLAPEVREVLDLLAIPELIRCVDDEKAAVKAVTEG